jgi:hypothetical protein
VAYRRTVIVDWFNRQPQLASAGAVFLLGLLAIFTGLPTHLGSTTLAGALFGAGASFIGAWVAERNRVTAKKNAEARRMQAARVYFTPELARIIGQQVWALDRLVANFIMASVDKPMPQVEPWETFRPRRPVLYPAAAQFRDLSDSDATALTDFYDSVHGIAETIENWLETKTRQEINTWNVLMQSVRDSLRLGAVAVESFCPDRQLSPLMPASGTLMQNIVRSSDGTQQALNAHLARAASRHAKQ